MLKKVLLCLILVPGITFHHLAQSAKDQWVDSVFHTLNIDDKIGQLFMVPVYPRGDRDYIEEIREAVKSHRVGGIIFMEGGPVQIANLTQYIQQTADVPVLIGVESDRGLGKLIDSTMIFPKALMLGAIQHDSLVYAMAGEIARQMKLLGLHINFAPSADRIMINKYDSLERSFGDDKINVANKAVAYMKGLQDNGIMACAKHFPVQGLTIVDIKKGQLPVLRAYIDSVELFPYKKLFSHNISGVLPASSDFPLFYQKKRVIRKNKFSPALLTSIYAGDWLKKNMNYQGLTFVSIPDIQDKAGRYKDGEAEMLSFEAGNDIILFPEEINPAVRKIKRLIRKNSSFQTQLDNTVKKILAAKYDAGLHHIPAINTDNLYRRLHTLRANLLKRRIEEQIVTIARDDDNILPIRILENKKIATLSIGEGDTQLFQHMTAQYADVDHFTIHEATQADDVLEKLTGYNTILVALFPGADPSVFPDLETLQQQRHVVICVFNSPTVLQNLTNFNSVVMAYSSEASFITIVPQVLFGALPSSGTLPLTINDQYRTGQGHTEKSLKRLSYSIPEDAGMDSRVLGQIEAIAHEAIDLKATPGCYVLVAREGKIVYEKSFGHLTYENTTPVSDDILYDLASITKVSATLQAVMFMHDRGLIDLNKKASYYLPELKASNKKDYTLKDILTHQAGLWPFLPFWAQTLKDSLFMPEFYSANHDTTYPFMVAEGLYAATTMKDSLWHWIIKAKVRDKVARTPYDYRYSDMGFYILHHLSEKVLNQPMEDFLEQNLYEPLGAYTMGYLPLNKFPKSRIAPTEDDKLFRKRLLVGTVHDQGAAMHGGIAGHAGLFSTALDLAKLGQMLLQEGYYGGLQYYKPETVRLFTRKQFETSRRGIGWDKPVQSEWNSPTSIYASPKTFGHTGFTGTCLWVDPEFNLVYVFLSNRVHPEMTNNKLLTANIRSRIQDVLYQSIFSYCKKYNVLEQDNGTKEILAHQHTKE